MTEAERGVRPLPWRRLVAEGLAIVLSILLAFAIDAWWDGLQERQDESELLGSLLVEFQTNRDRLPGRANRHRNTVAAAEAILSTLRAVEPGEMVPIADTLLMWSMLSGSFDPVRGALDAALQSGDLDLITSHDLQARLAAWPAQLQDASENERDLRGWLQPRYLDLLSRETDIGDILDQFREVLASGRPGVTGEREVQATSEILSVLSWIKFVAEEVVLEQGQLVNLADSVIAAIDTELAR